MFTKRSIAFLICLLMGVSAFMGCGARETSDAVAETSAETTEEVTTTTVVETAAETEAETTTTTAEITTTETETTTAEITTTAEETITAAANSNDTVFICRNDKIKYYYDYNSGFSDSSDVPADVIEKAKKCLEGNERYNDFMSAPIERIDNKPCYSDIYGGGDEYIGADGKQEPKVKCIVTADFSGDGTDETLLVLSTAYLMAEVFAENEFLVYINDSGEAALVMQWCGIEFYDLLDYGDFCHMNIWTGENNSTRTSYVYSFDGTEAHQLLDNYDNIVPDQKSGIVFLPDYMPDTCRAAEFDRETGEYRVYDYSFDDYLAFEDSLEEE